MRDFISPSKACPQKSVLRTNFLKVPQHLKALPPAREHTFKASAYRIKPH